MRWYSVRAIYAHRDSDRTWFDERIVLLRAPDDEMLIERANGESARYLELNPNARRVGELSAFALNEKRADLDGSEVWSIVRESPLEPDAFYVQHYAALEPDDSEVE